MSPLHRGPVSPFPQIVTPMVCGICNNDVGKGKGACNWYSASSWIISSEVLRYGTCFQGISQFHLHTHTISLQSEWAIPALAFPAIHSLSLERFSSRRSWQVSVPSQCWWSNRTICPWCRGHLWFVLMPGLHQLSTRLLQLSSGRGRWCLSSATPVSAECGSLLGLTGLFFLAYAGFQYASELSTRWRCLCGSVYMMQPSLFGWPVCAGPLVHGCQQLHSTAGSLEFHSISDYWSHAPGLLPVSAASPSMDHKGGTVCHLNSEHQIRLCTPSSVISRPACFSSSLCCCWQVGSAPFIRHRCDCSASSAPTTNIQTYLLTSVSLSTVHWETALFLHEWMNEWMNEHD